LIDKVRLIEQELSPDIFCILFDDMRGDTPQLASTQLRMIEDVAASTAARRIVMCPTYYSTDPVLERVFGAMPERYWETLASGLDPRVGVFWTGPKVCSAEYPRAHLESITERLGRKPFLWDNYPVNDSRAMSAFLHLRAFTQRPAALRELLAGHAANPMKQPMLSQIPLATLSMSYAQGEGYEPSAAWRAAAERAGGTELADLLQEDLSLFQDVGLDRLTPEQRSKLETRYRPYAAHPIGREIIGWMNGEYAFDPACLTD
jgi:hyaluronoglucosaminidase